MPYCESNLHTTPLNGFELKGIPASDIEAAVLAEILKQVIADREANNKPCGGDCYNNETEKCKANIPGFFYDQIKAKLSSKAYLDDDGKPTVDVILNASAAATISIGSSCECLLKKQKKVWY
jgi:hypothetical protein